LRNARTTRDVRVMARAEEAQLAARPTTVVCFALRALA
jgi:hypothetical protein